MVGPDVYSYDEDDMVLDPKLPEHLAHFGINMMTMEKVRPTRWVLQLLCQFQMSIVPTFPAGILHKTFDQVLEGQSIAIPLLYCSSVTEVKYIGFSPSWHAWQTSRHLWASLPHRATIDYMVLQRSLKFSCSMREPVVLINRIPQKSCVIQYFAGSSLWLFFSNTFWLYTQYTKYYCIHYTVVLLSMFTCMLIFLNIFQ